MRFFFNPDFDFFKIYITELNLNDIQKQIRYKESEYIYLSYFEQNANNLKFNFNEYMFSIWSYLSMADFFSLLLLCLIWSPLLFSISILIVYI